MTRPDYDRIIDAETWAFIRETGRYYPQETAGFTVAEQRVVYNRMCRAFYADRPAGVTAADREVGKVRCRVYEAGGAEVTVVYLHGGGFVVGGLESHDDVCAELGAATGFRVVAVDYRLAPEHRHPASFDDALAVVRGVAGLWPGGLLLAGDSAGGNLAAAVSHALRGGGIRIAGQVLIYPGLGGDRDAGSYLTHAEAPMLTRADVLFYAEVRFEGGVEPPGDVTASPLADSDFSGLPPTVLIAAECDPLCDDAVVYARRIHAAGGRAEVVVEPGLVHGYLRARHSVKRAAASFGRMVEALRHLGAGHWPY